MIALERVFGWAFTIGFISFLIGFFGPMIVAPGANQGPMLGIFITGPLGGVIGFAIGISREMLGYTASPGEFAARPEVRAQLPRVLRIVAGIAGAFLLLNGIAGVARDGSRGSAAAMVVGGAALWYAFAGRMPAWFRR